MAKLWAHVTDPPPLPRRERPELVARLRRGRRAGHGQGARGALRHRGRDVRRGAGGGRGAEATDSARPSPWRTPPRRPATRRSASDRVFPMPRRSAAGRDAARGAEGRYARPPAGAPRAPAGPRCRIRARRPRPAAPAGRRAAAAARGAGEPARGRRRRAAGSAAIAGLAGGARLRGRRPGGRRCSNSSAPTTRRRARPSRRAEDLRRPGAGALEPRDGPRQRRDAPRRPQSLGHDHDEGPARTAPPHALHIHAGQKGVCPPGSAAGVHNGHISIATHAGGPFYGSPVVALTTRGNTSPKNFVAFKRYPTPGTSTTSARSGSTVVTAGSSRRTTPSWWSTASTTTTTALYDGSLDRSDLVPQPDRASRPRPRSAARSCGEAGGQDHRAGRRRRDVVLPRRCTRPQTRPPIRAAPGVHRPLAPPRPTPGRRDRRRGRGARQLARRSPRRGGRASGAPLRGPRARGPRRRARARHGLRTAAGRAGRPRSKLGRILVDQPVADALPLPRGQAHRSTCYGGCARVWPPAVALDRHPSGPGIARGKLTTTPAPARQAGSSSTTGTRCTRTTADTRPGSDRRARPFSGRGSSCPPRAT